MRLEIFLWLECFHWLYISLKLRDFPFRSSFPSGSKFPGGFEVFFSLEFVFLTQVLPRPLVPASEIHLPSGFGTF